MDLVSVLIPAYKPVFLRQALLSAMGQTYSNIEIIVGDDCPSDDVAKLCAEFPAVQYRRNPNSGRRGLNNLLFLIGLAKGRFIKFLFDDDILKSDCIQKMMAVALADSRVSLVFSPRTIIDKDGAFQRVMNPLRLKKLQYFRGCELVRLMAERVRNPIGELTTILVRTDCIVSSDCFSVDGQIWSGLGDVALFVNALQHGDAVALPEPLTDFRMHDAQNTSLRDFEWSLGFSDWLYLIHFAYRTHCIGRFRAALSCLRLARYSKQYRGECIFLGDVQSSSWRKFWYYLSTS